MSGFALFLRNRYQQEEGGEKYDEKAHVFYYGFDPYALCNIAFSGDGNIAGSFARPGTNQSASSPELHGCIDVVTATNDNYLAICSCTIKF